MDNNGELVIVNINGGYGHVYDFCTLEDSQAKLNQAQANAIENVETYNRYIKDYPQQADYWTKCKKEYESAKYEAMTFDEFLKRQKIAFTTGEITEVTEEKFDDMLNVLPPLYWTTIGGVEMFCMGEFYTGTYTTQYARVGDKYYTAMVDATDRETWIHKRLAAA